LASTDNQETEQMQTNGTHKVALMNSSEHTHKTYAKREDKQSLV